MEILGGEKVAIHSLYQSIQHIAGSEGPMKVRSSGKRRQVLSKLLQLVHH